MDVHTPGKSDQVTFTLKDILYKAMNPSEWIYHRTKKLGEISTAVFIQSSYSKSLHLIFIKTFIMEIDIDI